MSMSGFPLTEIHPRAFAASQAAHCAGEQEKYCEMHERLFARPMRLQPENLVAHARDLQLDATAFAKCLGPSSAALVNAEIALGRRLGVVSTPSFFVGRTDAGGRVNLVSKISGAVSLGVFDEEIARITGASPTAWQRLKFLVGR